MILMYAPERRSEKVKLGLIDVPENWQASGPGIQASERMDRARIFASTFESYDALTDAPIEAGKLKSSNWKAWYLTFGWWCTATTGRKSRLRAT